MNKLRLIQLLLFTKLFVFSVTTYAQDHASATPVFVILTTPTPRVVQAVATSTPTFTPTPIGVVLLEAKEEFGNITVRTEPGPEADSLGLITYGTLHPVYRQFYNWYEIEFELSPNNRAWVYLDYVDVIGNPFDIEVIEDFNWATPQAGSSSDSDATDVPELSESDVSSTPASRQIDAPTIESTVVEATQGPLPTFTYPPNINVQSPAQNQITQNPNTDTSPNESSPLVPILLLGGAGFIGLMFDAIRR